MDLKNLKSGADYKTFLIIFPVTRPYLFYVFGFFFDSNPRITLAVHKICVFFPNNNLNSIWFRQLYGLYVYLIVLSVLYLMIQCCHYNNVIPNNNKLIAFCIFILVSLFTEMNVFNMSLKTKQLIINIILKQIGLIQYANSIVNTPC